MFVDIMVKCIRHGTPAGRAYDHEVTHMCRRGCERKYMCMPYMSARLEVVVRSMSVNFPSVVEPSFSLWLRLSETALQLFCPPKSCRCRLLRSFVGESKTLSIKSASLLRHRIVLMSHFHPSIHSLIRPPPKSNSTVPTPLNLPAGGKSTGRYQMP